MADATKARTHTAFALKREGKRFGRWLEIGVARAEKDGSIRVFLDRTPIGGIQRLRPPVPDRHRTAAVAATEPAAPGAAFRR